MSGKKTDTMNDVYEEAIKRHGKSCHIPFNNVMVEYHAGVHDFKNKFDAPKLDHRRLLPDKMKEDYAYILLCGNPETSNNDSVYNNKKITAKYAFILGSEKMDGYVDMPIFEKDDFEEYDPSEKGFFRSDISIIGSAEATALSTLGSYGIASSFFGKKPKDVPMIHDSRRARLTATIETPCKDGFTSVDLNSVQIEVDGYWEWQDLIVGIEGKKYPYSKISGKKEPPNICWRQLRNLIEYTRIELKRIGSSKELKYVMLGEVTNHPFGEGRTFYITEFSLEEGIIDFDRKAGYILPEGW